jgi:hypothetical protein
VVVPNVALEYLIAWLIPSVLRHNQLRYCNWLGTRIWVFDWLPIPLPVATHLRHSASKVRQWGTRFYTAVTQRSSPKAPYNSVTAINRFSPLVRRSHDGTVVLVEPFITVWSSNATKSRFGRLMFVCPSSQRTCPFFPAGSRPRRRGSKSVTELAGRTVDGFHDLLHRHDLTV